MPKIQLIADPEFAEGYSLWLSKLSGLEIVEHDPEIILDLRFLRPETKLADLSRLDAKGALIISNTLTHSVTSASSALGKSARVAGAPIFPNYIARQKLVEFMLPMGSVLDPSEVRSVFGTLGLESEQVGDSVAGIFPRSLAMIINEGAFAVQEGVATAADIDTAMKLGTNYPTGPLHWCDEIGAQSVVAVLDALSKEYGPDRYRSAALLRRMAEAGGKFRIENGEWRM